MDLNTDKKIAVITGASSGIGKGIARYFLKKDYKTILIVRDRSKLKDLINDFDDIVVLEFDLRNYQDIVQNIKIVLRDELKIDVLVNSAGYVKSGTSELSHEEFVKMLETNLVALFDLSSAIIPIMKKQRSGRIINIGSYSGVVAQETLGGYAASKFGLMGLNEALHKELAPYGIYVTAICPNLVDTKMTEDVISIPKNEFIQVEDVVKTVDYLLSVTSNVMIREIVLRCRAKLLKSIE